MIRIESQQDAEKATILRQLFETAFKAGAFGLIDARNVAALDAEIVAEGKRWDAEQQKGNE